MGREADSCGEHPDASHTTITVGGALPRPLCMRCHVGFIVLRFDLIFLMLDPQDDAFDRRLATHLVSLYHQSQERMKEEFMVLQL